MSKLAKENIMYLMVKTHNKCTTGDPQVDCQLNFANAKTEILENALLHGKRKNPLTGGKKKVKGVEIPSHKGKGHIKKPIKIEKDVAELAASFGMNDEEIQESVGGAKVKAKK